MGVLNESRKHEVKVVGQSPMIGRPTALVMIVVFAALILTPSVHQFGVELRGTGRWRLLALFREVPTRAAPGEAVHLSRKGLVRLPNLCRPGLESRPGNLQG